MLILEEPYPYVPIHYVQVSASVSHSAHKLPQTKKEKNPFLDKKIIYTGG